jgi:hypothetical protein
VGEEAVVRYSRKVPVAGGDPCRGRRIANDYDLEALLQKMMMILSYCLGQSDCALSGE